MNNTKYTAKEIWFCRGYEFIVIDEGKITNGIIGELTNEQAIEVVRRLEENSEVVCIPFYDKVRDKRLTKLLL